MNYIFIVFLVLMVGLMWWMQRSQKKAQQKRQDQVNTLTKGTDVVTIGGLHGKIDSVGETTIDIDCEGVILTFEKSAVRPPALQPMAAASNPVSADKSTPSDPVSGSKDEAKSQAPEDGIEK